MSLEKLIQKRVAALVAAREEKLGRKLDDGEAEELRSFAAEAIADISGEAVKVLDAAEKVGLTNEDGELVEDPEKLVLASGDDKGEEGEGDFEEVSDEEAVEAMLAMSDEEFDAFFSGLDPEDQEVVLAQLQAAEGGELVGAAASRSFAGMTPEQIYAQAMQVAQEAAQERIDADRRAFALAQDVDDQGSFVDTLVAEGRITPAQREGAQALLIAAISVQGETRSYAAAELGEYGASSLGKLARDFLSSFPPQVAFKKMHLEESGRSFAAQDLQDWQTDTSAAQRVMQAVRQLREAEPGLTHSEAMVKLQNQGRN